MRYSNSFNIIVCVPALVM